MPEASVVLSHATDIACLAGVSVFFSLCGGAVVECARELDEQETLLSRIYNSVKTRSLSLGSWKFSALASMLIGMLAYATSGMPLSTLLFLTVIGTLLSVIDAELQIIPEELTWVLLFGGLLISPFWADYQVGIIGACISLSGMWLVMAFIENRTGLPVRSGGDLAAAAAGGAWVGMTNAGAYLLLSACIWVLYQVVMARGKRWVAMGPALIIAIPFSPSVTPWIADFANALHLV